MFTDLPGNVSFCLEFFLSFLHCYKPGSLQMNQYLQGQVTYFCMFHWRFWSLWWVQVVNLQLPKTCLPLPSLPCFSHRSPLLPSSLSHRNFFPWLLLCNFSSPSSVLLSLLLATLLQPPAPRLIQWGWNWWWFGESDMPRGMLSRGSWEAKEAARRGAGVPLSTQLHLWASFCQNQLQK